LLFTFSGLFYKASASHAAGGEIIYEHVSDSTYRFFFKFYRDCTGIAAPSTAVLCYKSDCHPQVNQTNMALWPGKIPPGVDNGSSVSLGCSNASTTCEGSGGQPGYEEYWYYVVLTLPYSCDAWTFSTYISARNASNNLLGANNFYTETTFNNTISDTNSSPYFSIKPIPYCCLNTPFQYNNGAVDPDGDSLVSEVVNPMQASS